MFANIKAIEYNNVKNISNIIKISANLCGIFLDDKEYITIHYYRLVFKVFLKDELPVFPDYGQLMTGGCHGFAKNTMKWPEDLIIGGVKHENYKLISAEAFQSVFLVASGQDVYLRFKVVYYIKILR